MKELLHVESNLKPLFVKACTGADVLEAIDPAAAILEFAKVNHVDHIIMGARQNSMMRALLGSVSAKVVAEANCTVTVVRSPCFAVDAQERPKEEPELVQTSLATGERISKKLIGAVGPAES